MSEQPTLLFCVGATKAGTGWLFDHLSRHADCHLRSIKELHYFNALDDRRRARQVTLHRARAARAAQALRDRPAQGRALARLADHEAWLSVLSRPGEDRAAYLGYLTDGRQGQRIVGDFTPAYATLPVDRLAAMARLGPDVRMVYLMRDPVDRLWSHVRMLARRIASPDEIGPAAERLFDEVLAGRRPDVVNRGDYVGAVARLRAAVEPERLLILSQAGLLCRAGLARLSTFLGIAEAPADVSRRVNAGPQIALGAERHARAYRALRPHYDLMHSLFPDEVRDGGRATG